MWVYVVSVQRKEAVDDESKRTTVDPLRLIQKIMDDYEENFAHGNDEEAE